MLLRPTTEKTFTFPVSEPPSVRHLRTSRHGIMEAKDPPENNESTKINVLYRTCGGRYAHGVPQRLIKTRRGRPGGCRR